jgi:hypothetical protein
VSPLALVTCNVLPEPDPDEAPILAACAEVGIDVSMVAWDDPNADWSRYGCVVLHSCWNYYEEPGSFRNWIERTSKQTRLMNSSSLTLENLDKAYLGELGAKGIPIVPTRYLEKPSDLSGHLRDTGWECFVIKPTISAASFMTKRFSITALEEAEEFAAEILKTRGAMVQPYLPSVESGGEVAVVHVDGKLTHCIFKEPRFSDADECVSHAFQPDEVQVAAAQKVMDTVAEPWLYARVDLMKSSSGEWLLSELELIEPTLFLLQHEPALKRFVSALGKVAAA